MRVILPVKITDAVLAVSNVPEDPAPLWTEEVTYELGDSVHVVGPDLHLVFESLRDDNTGKNPLDDDQAAPVNWLEIGPTNRWRMFDVLRNTQTEHPTPLIVDLLPNKRINSIALLGLDAEHVQIEMLMGEEVVYSKEIDLIERQTLGYYDYFFGEFSTLTGFPLFDLPPYTAAMVRVTITRVAGNVKCGSLVVGNNQYIGRVQHSAESDALNFSRVERDDFGNTKLVPRRSIPKTDQTLHFDPAATKRLMTLREELNAVPAVWSGVDDTGHNFFEALFILGIYKQMRLNLANADFGVMTLELEEI